MSEEKKSGMVICDAFDPLKSTDPWEHPKTLTKSRHVCNKLFLAGVGNAKNPKIMIVAATAIDDEFKEGWSTGRGTINPTTPVLLKGDHGNILRRQWAKAGLDLEKDAYYTTVVKWRLPQDMQKRPKPKHLQEGLPLLMWEIETLKPDVVMCMGKTVFDLLMGQKFQLREVEGAWIKKEIGDHQVMLYPTIPATEAVRDPSKAETLYLDAVEMHSYLDETKGVVRFRVPEEHEVISTKAELEALVERLMPYKRFSIDCEWAGRNPFMGMLRSTQLCWDHGKAAYIRFKSPDAEGPKDKFGMAQVMDCTYEEAGKILARLYLREGVKFIGHQISADMPWLRHVLKIDLTGRVEWDTLYAMQCINEYAPGKLELMAARRTGMPRWDIDLAIWKKSNPIDDNDGYGRVPDAILIPYGCRDVDGPFRMVERQKFEMVMQNINLLKYYNNSFLPFVADAFAEFSYRGLPIDVRVMEELRDLFLWARTQGQHRLGKEIVNEARKLFSDFMDKNSTMSSDEVEMLMSDTLTLSSRKDSAEVGQSIFLRLKEAVTDVEKIGKLEALWTHLADAPKFNLRSPDHMRRWLFEVKGLTPLRSTGNKESGKPSIAWEKVMAYDKAKQAEFKPATDKNTLSAYADDPIIQRLLQINLVGNITKSFLRPSEYEVDEETGEEEEVPQGLHAWVSSDGYIHGMFSATETARPRSWNPNSLNLPKEVHKKIEVALKWLFDSAKADAGVIADVDDYTKSGLPNRFVPFADGKKIIPLRAIVTAPKGFVLVESDYKTAEMRGLAFISGDEAMIETMTAPDKSFGLVWPKGSKEPVPVRLFYDKDSGIAPENQLSQFKMAEVSKRKKIKDLPGGMEEFLSRKDDHNKPLVMVDESRGEYVECRKISFHELLKKDGKFMHPDHDVHWELIEVVRKKPREALDKATDRGAGKVGNFSSCLTSSTLVLTNEGYVRIVDVQLHHKLWDGIEWVSHDGVIYQGRREVINYHGLTATKCHNVWLTDGRKVSLGEAFLTKAQLCRTATEAGECQFAGFESVPRGSDIRSEVPNKAPDGMHVMRAAGLQGSGKSSKGPCRVPVSQHTHSSHRREEPESHTLRGRESEDVGTALPLHGTALSEGHAQTVVRLQRARHRGAVRELGGLHNLGTGQMARHGLQRVGLRARRQRRALLEGQPHPGEARTEPSQSPRLRSDTSRVGGQIHDSASRGLVFESNNTESHGAGFHGRADSGEAYQSPTARKEAPEVREPGMETHVDVYDILNAGPRRRFTANGFLVSNCYGASPASLERKIYSDTGVKPADGTGQALLDALKKKWPKSQQWLIDQEEKPKKGVSVAFSGRRRHFPQHDRESQVSFRNREASLSAWGREARNFPMQHSVADVAGRACLKLMRHYRREGMQATVMALLYDSIVTLCPLHERFEVARLHQRYMCDETWEEYHGRILKYPIDTEFNYRWSDRPTKEDLSKLDDETWDVTPPAEALTSQAAVA